MLQKHIKWWLRSLSFVDNAVQHSSAQSKEKYTQADRWRSKNELTLTTWICQLSVLPFQNVAWSKVWVSFTLMLRLLQLPSSTFCYIAQVTVGSFTFFLSTHTHTRWVLVMLKCITHIQTRIEQPTYIFQVFSLFVTTFWRKERKSSVLFHLINLVKAFVGEKQMKWEQKFQKRTSRTIWSDWERRRKKIMSIINMSTIQWQWISEWITICRCWWWTPCISFPVNQPLFWF